MQNVLEWDAVQQALLKVSYFPDVRLIHEEWIPGDRPSESKVKSYKVLLCKLTM